MRTRTTRRDATALESAETNLRTDYVFRNGATATHVKTWLSRFTADVAGAIESEQPLPSGTWSMAGTSSWTRGANTYALTVTTSPPLHFNASCGAGPRFDSGTLIVVVVRGGRTATVSIRFAGCGEYSVSRS